MVAAVVAGWLLWMVFIRAGAPAWLPDLPRLVDAPRPVAEHLRVADAAVRRAPDVAGAVAELAMAYHSSGYPDRAERLYVHLQAAQANDERWPYLRVLLAEQRGDIDVPLELLLETVRRNPDATAAWYRLGQVYFKRGDDDAAGDALRRAMREPFGAHAALGLARIALRQDNLAAARDMLESAVKRRPQSAPLHRLLGQVYQQLGRAEDAAYESAVAANMLRDASPPEPLLDELASRTHDRSFLLERSMAAGRAGDHAAQRRWLERAARIYPGDQAVQRALGEAVRAEQARVSVADDGQFTMGRQLFVATCALCHGPDGQGQAGKAPPLVGSPWLGESPSRVIRIVLDGVRSDEPQFDRQMPALRAFEDEQLAAILSDARRRWAPGSEPIRAEQVAAIRAATASRQTAWTRDELNEVQP
jgi:mono/diheme cytochrome c family protein/Tfp pilus assembly protein PilF